RAQSTFALIASEQRLSRAQAGTSARRLGFLYRNLATLLWVAGCLSRNFLLFMFGHNSKGAPAVGRQKNGGLIKDNSQSAQGEIWRIYGVLIQRRARSWRWSIAAGQIPKRRERGRRQRSMPPRAET